MNWSLHDSENTVIARVKNVVGALAAWWEKFKASFHDSETIVIARVKNAVGILALILVKTDMTPFLTDPRWRTAWGIFAAYLIADGTIGEWARKRRATDL